MRALSASSDHEKRAAPAGTRFPLWQARIQHPLIFIALIGLLWSSFASFFVWRWEERRADENLVEVANSYFVLLQHGLNEYLGKLDALHALFESADHVSREEFEAFAGRLLFREGAIQNLSWAPQVLHKDRAAFEAAARRSGLPNYRIKEVTADDRVAVSPDKNEYMPILYSTVADKSSQIYGIDLLSQPVIEERLQRARDNDSLSVVPDFTLHSQTGNVHGFLFSMPVYRRDSMVNTVEERRRAFLGFAHGAFVTEQAIEHIIAGGSVEKDLDIYLFAADASPDTAPLYVHRSRLEHPGNRLPTLAAVTKRQHVAGELQAGDAYWALVAVPAPGGSLSTRHDRFWLVLAASLLVSLLVLLYTRSTVRHADILMLANREISAVAEHDALTGLANRLAFNKRLAEVFAQARREPVPFALLYFDLDHFKDTNDTMGHPAGDILLRQVAVRLKDIVRAGDVVARFGGDEFAVLQMRATAADAAALAGRINETLAIPYVIENNTVQISASIGIACNSPAVASTDALFIQADLALYRAKEDGRNCYRFHDEQLNREVRERVVLGDELRGAAARNELRLYYQPQIELATRRIVGLEALLRWQHPTRGLLSPAQFVAVAERTGTICSLGEWTFNEACRQMRAWLNDGLCPGVLAVNFSAIQFKVNADVDRFVSDTISKWKIEPASMEIELTESVLMEVTRQHRETLERMRGLGVRIAIDDFGTGYSSLNYLTCYPVNRLKIAQELVFGVTNDRRNATVVRAAIRLAGELGIESIAEGVETAEQMNFLMAAGCCFGQGYYISKPVDAAEMTKLLKKRILTRGRVQPRLELVAS